VKPGAPSLIHVVAGVVIDSEERVLIAQRPAGKHLAGGWEFPGGKLKPGEERLAGLARELLEEIGITIANPRPLMRIRHSYSYGDVLLDIWVVRSYSGQPQGLDDQALRWCTQEQLATADLLPADRPIVAALRLPAILTRASTPYYRIGEATVERAGDSGDSRLSGVFCPNAGQAVAAAAAGADFLVMNAALAMRELAALCESIPQPLFAAGIELERAWGLGASGVNQIEAADAGPAEPRRI
jgi:mutator protein MutT